MTFATEQDTTADENDDAGYLSLLDEDEQDTTDSQDEQDIDLDDTGEDAHDSDEIEEQDGKTTSGGQGSARRGAGLTRALARRILDKGEQIRALEASDLAVLATVYGVSEDWADVTSAIMTVSRTALAPITDLTSIREASPFRASMIAQELGVKRMRAVHALLVTLDAASVRSLSGAETKMAARLAEDVHSMDTAAIDRLDLALELAKRTV